MHVQHRSLFVLLKAVEVSASYFKQHAKKKKGHKNVKQQLRHIGNKVVFHFLQLFSFKPPFQTSPFPYAVCMRAWFHCKSSASCSNYNGLFQSYVATVSFKMNIIKFINCCDCLSCIIIACTVVQSKLL
jgi:hypothetical protein